MSSRPFTSPAIRILRTPCEVTATFSSHGDADAAMQIAKRHQDLSQWVDDLALLPPDMLPSVAAEPPRTIAKLEKVAYKMRRYASRCGRQRPSRAETRDAAARLYGFASFTAAESALSSKQEPNHD